MLGVIGSAFLIITWLVPTIKIIYRKKSNMDPGFCVLFFIGTSFLLVYSMEINDAVFYSLNVILIILVLINLYYVPKKIATLEKEVKKIEKIVEEKVPGLKETYHVKKK